MAIVCHPFLYLSALFGDCNKCSIYETDAVIQMKCGPDYHNLKWSWRKTIMEIWLQVWNVELNIQGRINRLRTVVLKTKTH